MTQISGLIIVPYVIFGIIDGRPYAGQNYGTNAKTIVHLATLVKD